MTDTDVIVDVDAVTVNTIRTLVIDAVAAAKSGHPGAAIAMAPVGYSLWNHALTYDVDDPHWINRDRFVLSAGHASMLLYALLHLAGVQRADGTRRAVELDDIRRFRQLGSPCAGHPEHELLDGVECTTGPLGTGIATSVGMAMAAKWQAATFNRPGFDVFDYRVYALAGDGDGDAREERDPPGGGEHASPILHDHAPGGLRWWNSDAQKAQRGLKNDRAADLQRGEHEQRGQEVR